MVPKEEERLPIRVPVSVRGLNAFESSFLIPFFTFASHGCCASCMVKLEHSPCFLQTILLIESSLSCSTFFCMFLGRYRPYEGAVRLYDNQ